MDKLKVYVASSWRNMLQQGVVMALRQAGCEVYDFKNPAPGGNGFRWTEIDPGWQRWKHGQYQKALEHPIAVKGYSQDMSALEDADVCVLVLPCGRSAHLEAGWAAGRGKPVCFLLEETFEPELMYKMGDTADSLYSLLLWIEEQQGVFQCVSLQSIA